jgi:hypothetical protein
MREVDRRAITHQGQFGAKNSKRFRLSLTGLQRTNSSITRRGHLKTEVAEFDCRYALGHDGM